MEGFVVRSPKELDQYRDRILENVEQAVQRLVNEDATYFKKFFQMKFEQVGFHPVADKPLNFIEQLNQTFTYLAAVDGARMIWKFHPEVRELTVYPGAHAPKGTLDIEATDGASSIGAETFSAVKPSNNGKLNRDIQKLLTRKEVYRYIFFISPKYPENKRQAVLEAEGVQVWSLWPFEEF